MAVADRDHHHRHVRVASGEASPLALAMSGAVDTQQDGRAGDAALMQQLYERPLRRLPADAGVAAEVDGQVGRLMRGPRQLDGVQRAGEHARALERDE